MPIRATLTARERKRLESSRDLLERTHDRVCREDGINPDIRDYDNSVAWEADHAMMEIDSVLVGATARDQAIADGGT